MAKALVILGGATVSAEEVAKVEQALAALEADVHAPRETSVKVTLHIHREYPKVLSSGVVVNSAEEEAAEEEK